MTTLMQHNLCQKFVTAHPAGADIGYLVAGKISGLLRRWSM
jgi:hypothetical protein